MVVTRRAAEPGRRGFRSQLHCFTSSATSTSYLPLELQCLQPRMGVTAVAPHSVVLVKAGTWRKGTTHVGG